MESNPPGYAPLVYFWIAHYSDGQCLPQFDPEDGHENLFGDIDQSKLIKFGYYPFTEELRKIAKAESRIDPTLRPIEILLSQGRRLIAIRRNAIIRFECHLCNSCGMLWRQRLQPEGDGLPISFRWHRDLIEVEGKERIFQFGICPRCGAHNALLCQKCGNHKNKYGRCFACGDAVSNGVCIKCGHKQPGPQTDFIYRCPTCGIDLPDRISLPTLERRITEYILGWQETIAGRNQKILIHIQEDGSMVIAAEPSKLLPIT